VRVSSADGEAPPSSVGTPEVAAGARVEEAEIGSGLRRGARYVVNVKKPLGIVFEETKEGALFVAELVDGGAADRAGVTVGDKLVAVSANVYSKPTSYGGVVVNQRQETVRLQCLGEDFDTIMAAIGTIKNTQPCRLEFDREACLDPEAEECVLPPFQAVEDEERD